MKKIIRKNVFESNSSSTHSFSYSNSTYNDLKVDYDNYYDNYIHTSLGEFGWEIKDYFSSSAKLDYILLVAANYEDCYLYSWDEEQARNLAKFQESSLFKEIEAVVKEYMDCDGIVLEEYSQGYIDHQSLEYDTFEDWLYNTGASSIEDFIFGDIVLHTDNDNHW